MILKAFRNSPKKFAQNHTLSTILGSHKEIEQQTKWLDLSYKNDYLYPLYMEIAHQNGRISQECFFSYLGIKDDQ
jgi:hypothetical protein